MSNTVWSWSSLVNYDDVQHAVHGEKANNATTKTPTSGGGIGVKQGELVRATYKGDAERVGAMLAMGGDANAKDWNDFRRPPILQIASHCGHYDVIQVLLNNGAEIDAIDKYGYTALHKASKEGHEAIVKLLLRQGASVYLQGKSEDQIEVACRNGAYDVVESLIERGRAVTDKHLEAAYIAKRRDVAELLIRHCNAILRKARTDIHMICFLGLEYAFEIAVNAETLEAKDSNAMTPIMVAARCGHLRLVKRCLSKGACIEITDVRMNTPLHHATIGGHEKIVKTLVQNCTSVNSKESKGRTALHLACLGNHEKSLETLLQYGASVNELDIYGRAPLFYARSVNVMSELLRFGADIESRDSYNRTVLHVACEGKVEHGVVDTLLSHGVQLTAKDWRGNMAVVYAATNAQCELLEKVVSYTSNKSQKLLKETIENLEQALLQDMGLLKNMSIVFSVVKCGVNLDVTDENNRTPLVKALELYVDLMKDYPHLPTPEFLITDIRLLLFAGVRLDLLLNGFLLTHVYRVSSKTLHFVLAMGCGSECTITHTLLDEIGNKRDYTTIELLREFGYAPKLNQKFANLDQDLAVMLNSAPTLTSLCRNKIRQCLSKRPDINGSNGVRRLSNKIKGMVRGRFFKAEEKVSKPISIKSIELSLIRQLPVPKRLQDIVSFEGIWCVP